jgi:hypothetical protein
MRYFSSRFGLSIFIFISMFLSGCYEAKVKKAYDRLQIGASKEELHQLFHDVQPLKVRVVSTYGSATENEMRGLFFNSAKATFRDMSPQDLYQFTESLTYDGNTKVYSYHIKEVSRFGPTSYFYVVVFYNTAQDKVVAKAIVEDFEDPKSWATDKY